MFIDRLINTTKLLFFFKNRIATPTVYLIPAAAGWIMIGCDNDGKDEGEEVDADDNNEDGNNEEEGSDAEEKTGNIKDGKEAK